MNLAMVFIYSSCCQIFSTLPVKPSASCQHNNILLPQSNFSISKSSTFFATISCLNLQEEGYYNNVFFTCLINPVLRFLTLVRPVSVRVLWRSRTGRIDNIHPEVYFKDLAYVIVRTGTSDICRAGWRQLIL